MNKIYPILEGSYIKIKQSKCGFREIRVVTTWFSDGTKTTEETPGISHYVEIINT